MTERFGKIATEMASGKAGYESVESKDSRKSGLAKTKLGLTKKQNGLTKTKLGLTKKLNGLTKKHFLLALLASLSSVDAFCPKGCACNDAK